MKLTRFTTNSYEMGNRLSNRTLVRQMSDNSYPKQQLNGSRVEAASRYPAGLCKAICQGIIAEKENISMKVKPLMSVTSNTKKPDDRTIDHDEDKIGDEMWWACDDVSGEALDPSMVKKAREEEMSYIRKKGVWKKVRRKWAIENGIKIIDGRWVDINKGDTFRPKYRSRYVGKEFDNSDVEGLFAGTPPMEAFRLLLSDLATVEKKGNSKP